MQQRPTRRQFLTRSVTAAGAAVLAACTGRGEPEPATSNAPQFDVQNPSEDLVAQIDSQWPIKRVVYLMLENRSFDHMFGRFPGVEGATSGNRLGREVPLIRCPEWLPGDLPHDYAAALRHYNAGKLDSFADPVPFSDYYAYSQQWQEDIPNYWHWAENYVLSDHFFASAMGPSYPNHLYMIAGQSGGAHDNPENSAPRLVDGLPFKTWGCDHFPDQYVIVEREDGTTENLDPCFDFQTQGDTLNDARVPWAYYAAEPFQVGYIWSAYAAIRHYFEDQELWDRHIRPVDNLLPDIRAGALPAVTWITPRYELSDHPPWSTCHGQNWVTSIVNAIMRSPIWQHTAIFITWDEWGGFYDHVKPPEVDAFGLGFRVPLLTISPFAKKGYIDREVGEFCSVTKFIDDNWGLPHLTPRVEGTQNLSHVFNFDRARPRPPDPLPLLTSCTGSRFKLVRDSREWPEHLRELVRDQLEAGEDS
jgi:phospholipase C